MRDTTHIVFGRRGSSSQHLLGGWAHDDDTRTWTIGHESHAALPCPRRRGTYVLAITGAAFTSPAVPFQRLVVLANGAEVGRFLLSEPFKIECMLPWSLLAGAAALSISFRHPDAVRPRDVIDSGDHRWIAIAFHELIVQRAPNGTPEPQLPAAPTNDDDALPAALRRRVPVALGPRQVPFLPPGPDWAGRPVFGHFADVVARDSEHAAIDDGARVFTYAEAMQLAAGLAERIGEMTPRGTVVAVSLSNGAWLPIAMMACLAAGRTCALVDPDGPGAGLAPALQIGDAARSPAFADVPSIVLPPLQQIRGVLGIRLPAMQATALLVPSAPGSPSWVGISEAALLRDIAVYIETGHLNDKDRHLPVGPTASVAMARAVLAAMLTGGKLCTVDLRAATDTDPLPALRDALIDVCSGPLGSLLTLARLPGAYASLRATRLLRVDGGRLHWNDVAVLRSLLPMQNDILYAFGTPETLTCIQHFVTMPAAGADDLVPIGLALPGFAIGVRRDDGAAAADGDVGEIIVRPPLTRDRVATGLRARRTSNGIFAHAPDAEAAAEAPDPSDVSDAYGAVAEAWQAVLGEPPLTGEVFGAAGGDSLKLIEFAVELENRLKRRLEMSLLTLEMDAAAIAAAVSAAGAVPDGAPALLAHDLVLHFESLGGYCEFAFVQRACQVEPYSLLRFAGTRPDGLIGVLERRFEGFGDPETLDITVSDNSEYKVTETRTGFAFHTDILSEQVTQADLLIRESQRLSFLAQRMCDELVSARKIYIYRSHGPQEDFAMAGLHRALRLYGPNRLLWVMASDADHPMGSTRQITESLMLGYVDPGAVTDEGRKVRLESWLAVCAAAYRAFA